MKRFQSCVPLVTETVYIYLTKEQVDLTSSHLWDQHALTAGLKGSSKCNGELLLMQPDCGTEPGVLVLNKNL